MRRARCTNQTLEVEAIQSKPLFSSSIGNTSRAYSSIPLQPSHRLLASSVMDPSSGSDALVLGLAGTFVAAMAGLGGIFLAAVARISIGVPSLLAVLPLFPRGSPVSEDLRLPMPRNPGRNGACNWPNKTSTASSCSL